MLLQVFVISYFFSQKVRNKTAVVSTLATSIFYVTFADLIQFGLKLTKLLVATFVNSSVKFKRLVKNNIFSFIRRVCESCTEPVLF